MFIKVREMSDTSARIVGISNRIAVLSNDLKNSLLDMDVNIKKLKLLKKDVYFDYFGTARGNYQKVLVEIIDLDRRRGTPAGYWCNIDRTFGGYIHADVSKGQSVNEGYTWIADDVMDQWMTSIAAARKDNEDRIEQALILINRLSRQVMRNCMIGFGISILVGIMGVWFISRSIIVPLNKLKSGLKRVSDDNYTYEMDIASKDEFGELAAAFNDMNRQLKADDEIRSDFIATLSHEIRSPLSSIRESVNMLTEEVLGPVNDKQKKFLTIAANEIARITSLLNHLLDTSILVSGINKRQVAPFDPNQLVQSAILSITPGAKARGIRTEFKPLEQAPMVKGNDKEIMQVIINILDNALKFSPNNSRVDVRLTRGPGKHFLTCNISDEGPGIPEDKQSLIFKKYYRAREVRKHMDGVGLGLNIARRIVQENGGEIFVENKPDKGCTFSFTLPVV
ncbi:HAMP domain-containing sensor histidine kinase [Desulfobacter postgatei]|uniref:histidine kinase n=1 Tax=Desulfobacter postgatei 2ac9 TaxID=879212 RepID=I5B308_9BACT|nr:HAMP domain-containing sensor histidine kinase [Desulfobacter postgatei]EIM63871.1 signal transduction histidine kinase [Desulfobacter postgatei 2ac9]